MVTSCKLKFREDDYFFIPAYRTEKLENGEIETSLHKRYFVQNYRFHKKQFEKEALDIICQEINDSIPLTYLDFSFVSGIDAGWYTPIAEYIWMIEKPDTIRISKGKKAITIDVFVPFDCELNEKYIIMNDVK